MRIRPELGDPANTKHGYDVYMQSGKIVYVYANNRDQAARIAVKAGHVVASVNMVG